jgi:hypothetical protein
MSDVILIMQEILCGGGGKQYFLMAFKIARETV